jgi:hypothetical protein
LSPRHAGEDETHRAGRRTRRGGSKSKRREQAPVTMTLLGYAVYNNRAA